MELRDALDLITLRYCSYANNVFSSAERTRKAGVFLAAARRIFAEEQVRYTIDDYGGVHFAVDGEFENARIATIGLLAAAKYNGVRELFEKAYLAMDSVPPDGKSGIRAVFFSAESLFRLMYSDAPQLNAAAVNKYLKPLLDACFADQKPALHVAHKQLAALLDWIEGAHFYRHEPGTEEPAQPPLDLAIYMIAQGAAHIRWLAALHHQRTASSRQDQSF